MGKDELVTQSAALLGKYIRKTSSEVLEKKRSYKYVLHSVWLLGNYLFHLLSFLWCGVGGYIFKLRSRYSMYDMTILFGIASETWLYGRLTLDCMSNGYLHSSHFLMSDDLIHRWRHSWWTYFRDPEQKQGAMSGCRQKRCSQFIRVLIFLLTKRRI